MGDCSLNSCRERGLNDTSIGRSGIDGILIERAVASGRYRRIWVPFAGASIGESNDYEDTSLGLNVGIKHRGGWYMSYVSTSESIQLGYHFIHISTNSNYFGLGIRLPLGGIGRANHSSAYLGGSVLLSEERHFSRY